jgi:hypothetical protein
MAGDIERKSVSAQGELTSFHSPSLPGSPQLDNTSEHYPNIGFTRAVARFPAIILLHWHFLDMGNEEWRRGRDSNQQVFPTLLNPVGCRKSRINSSF